MAGAWCFDAGLQLGVYIDASAIVGAIVAVPTFGWGAAAGAAGAATFGAAATICYVNAQGAYNQQLNTCGLKYDNQMLNSCGRI